MMKPVEEYPLLTRLVAAAVNVSNKSGKILREIKKSGELNVREKAANDYVTRADFLSQLNIIKSLEKLFPRLKICGEEGELKEEYDDLELSFDETVLKEAENLPDVYKSISEDDDLFVWVDPLDGTREYTQGPEYSKEVTVLIGVSWNGRPIAGVMNQPFYKLNTENKENSEGYIGRCIWAIVGVGAFDSLNGRISEKIPTDRNRIVTTRSHITDIIKRDLNNIPNCELVNSGGAGYKTLKVIEGECDSYIYPRNGTKRWDTCAPEAIMRAIKGTLTDIFGNEYSYSKPENQLVDNCYGIVASFKQANYYCNYLSDEIKSQVLEEAKRVIEQSK